MKVLYSNLFTTLQKYEPHVLFFEDVFVNNVWDQYQDCWKQLADRGIEIIKCKTRDAILSIPETMPHTLYRVGQSVRTSNHGDIIVIEVPSVAFMALEMGPYQSLY